MEVDKIIHEPARLRIMMILSGLEQADFNFLLRTLGLTRGNLSRHMEKLQLSGYVAVNKTFNGRIPHTAYELTPAGAAALTQYWQALETIKQLRPQDS